MFVSPPFLPRRIELIRNTFFLQTNQAYRCFCTPDELAEIREGLKRSGSNNVYDRRGFFLTEEEVARKLRAGGKHVVRFKVSPSYLVQI